MHLWSSLPLWSWQKGLSISTNWSNDPYAPISEIDRAFALALQYDRQLGTTKPLDIPEPNSSINNFTVTHRRNHPPNRRPLCTHCGLQGHTIEKCYKKHGYPPGYKPKSRSPLGLSTLLTLELDLALPALNLTPFYHLLLPSLSHRTNINSCWP